MKNNKEVKPSIFYNFRQYVNRSFRDKRVANGLNIRKFFNFSFVIHYFNNKQSIQSKLRDEFGNHQNESYNVPTSQFDRMTFHRPLRNVHEDQKQ